MALPPPPPEPVFSSPSPPCDEPEPPIPPAPPPPFPPTEFVSGEEISHPPPPPPAAKYTKLSDSSLPANEPKFDLKSKFISFMLDKPLPPFPGLAFVFPDSPSSPAVPAPPPPAPCPLPSLPSPPSLPLLYTVPDEYVSTFVFFNSNFCFHKDSF